MTARFRFAADVHDIAADLDGKIVFAVVGCGKGNRTRSVGGQAVCDDLCRVRGKQRAGIADAAALVGHGCDTVYKIKLPSVIGNIAPGVHGKTQIARGFVGLDAEEIRIKALGRKRIGVFALSEQGAYLFELFGKAFRVQFDRSACPQLLFVEL